jgi:predicted O-methyltransferase YrrM
MYSKSRLAFKWIQYYVLASNARGHGIHSPFVYELIRSVLNDKRPFYAYENIEKVKKALLLDKRVIHTKDPGAGSLKKSTGSKKVSEIVGTSVSTRKFGRLLFRLANYYPAQTIIELGSSVGISTAYLASADHLNRVITLEGSDSVAEIANETFRHLELKNITTVTGNFDETLAEVISLNPPAELVFIDGNHRKKPVLDYFEKFMTKISHSSMIIIHDIHWSREMEEAWSLIQAHPKVKMSIDIFSAGLVFFREEFKVKQQFVIQF